MNAGTGTVAGSLVRHTPLVQCGILITFAHVHDPRAWFDQLGSGANLTG